MEEVLHEAAHFIALCAIVETDKPYRSARALSWIAVGLSLVLLVWGIVQYGLSLEVQQRFWSDIFAARPTR